MCQCVCAYFGRFNCEFRMYLFQTNFSFFSVGLLFWRPSKNMNGIYFLLEYMQFKMIRISKKYNVGALCMI